MPIDHKEYVEIQKKVTQHKLDTKTTSTNSQNLVNFAKDHWKSDAEVLCIGSRDRFELSKIRKHGPKNITAIDICPGSDEVKQMDMHNLEFSDNTFDTFFACHSLEHANDIDKVLSEIVRVAKSESILILEVPTEYKNNKRIGDKIEFDISPRFPGDSDFYDFENKDVFSELVGKYANVEILKDEYIRKDRGGYRAKGILKLILSLKK